MMRSRGRLISGLQRITAKKREFEKTPVFILSAISGEIPTACSFCTSGTAS